MIDSNKRELFGSLRSIFSDSSNRQKRLIRPPYFEKESDFTHACYACEALCAKACQEGIIKIADDKTPYIDLTKGGCTYCDECALACDFGVLKIEQKRELEIKLKIDITKCLSWNNTMCYSCKDICPSSAILFFGMFKAEIDKEICSRCGFCIKPCPVVAIEY